MRLVVDANILFASLIKAGATRELLLLGGHELFIPDHTLKEFSKHLSTLVRKTGFDENALRDLVHEFLRVGEIAVVPLDDFKGNQRMAEAISPDKDDVPYLALALHLNCPLWSSDAALKKQKKVRVVSTAELVKNRKGTLFV